MPANLSAGWLTLFVVLPVVTAVMGVLAGRYVPRPQRGSRLTMPVEAEAWARLGITRQLLDETQNRLREAEKQLDESRSNLAQAHTEVLRISGRAKVMSDRTEAEMGRLESAAITALDSTAASHREEVTRLRSRLLAAEEATRILQIKHDAECERSARLQSALIDRDRHIATLRANAPGHRA